MDMHIIKKIRKKYKSKIYKHRYYIIKDKNSKKIDK